MEENKKISKGFMIFVLILAIIILVFLQEKNQEKFNNLFNGITSKDLELILENEYLGNNLGYYKGSLIQFEDSILKYLDSEGQDVWIKDFGFVDPMIYYGDRAIYIVDKAAGDIYALDNKGNTLSKHQLFKAIFNLKESKEGIIVHLKEQGEESLVMMDKDGNELGEHVAGGNILTYDLNNDNSSYVYSSLSLDNQLTSKVMINDMDNDNKYSLELKDEIVVFTQFVKNQLLIITDNDVKIVQNGEVKWTKEYPLIKDVFVKNNEIYLLYGDNLEVLDLNGESKLKIILGLEYNNIRPIGNFLALYGNQNLMFLDGETDVIRYLADSNIVRLYGDEIGMALKLEDKIQILKFSVKETE